MARPASLALAVLVLTASPTLAQNLIANPGFDKTLAGWQLFAPFTVQRLAPDANGSPASGAARVTRPSTSDIGMALGQCVPVTPGYAYDFSAKVRTPAIDAFVLGVSFFTAEDCSGTKFTGVGTDTKAPAGTWHTVHVVQNAPPSAHSAQVGLYIEMGASVDFDDVYFETAAPPSCTPSASVFCVDRLPGDRRFIVFSRFATVQGGGFSGTGNAISLAGLGVSSGGLFSFFAPSNPEMLVKVLDGCPITGYFWIFVSAGTNVGVDLFVFDTVTRAVALFHNPDLGPYPAIQSLFGLPCS